MSCHPYLSWFGPLTDKGLVGGGKGGSIVVYVQEANEDRHMTGQKRFV